jgi:quinoprotein glucose dehydrogenase
LLAVVALVALSLAIPFAQSRQVEWLYYGGDQGGSKYSALTDVNVDTVQKLQIAWQWKHFDVPMEQYDVTPGQFEAVPLMIDGVLYVTTPYNSMAALDAETGRELWRFDGEAYKLGQILSGSGWKLRGPAFWRDGNKRTSSSTAAIVSSSLTRKPASRRLISAARAGRR